MVIDAIDQDYLDRSTFQGARGRQTPRASANDHDHASLVGQNCFTSRRGSIIGSCLIQSSRIGVQMIGVQVSSNSEDGLSTLETAGGGGRHHRDITGAHIPSPGSGWDTHNAAS